MKKFLLQFSVLIIGLSLGTSANAVYTEDTQVIFEGEVDGKIIDGSDTTKYSTYDWSMTWDEAGIGSISNVSFSTDENGISVNKVTFKITVSDGGSFSYEWPTYPDAYYNTKEFTDVKISVEYVWYDDYSHWTIDFKEYTLSEELEVTFNGSLAGVPDSSDGFQYAVYQAAQNQNDKYLTEDADDGTTALDSSDTLYLADFVDLMNEFTGEDYNTIYSYYTYSGNLYEITSGYLTDPEIVPEPGETALIMAGLMGALVLIRRKVMRRSATN
ncbi:PEP-CTERM sorting domain-containing protein [Cerasicoccus frondis]|uniref:PEP-CTERM sorting domain-containing protein n=1 Tax=Cerasicoccus frondis TaxID=490090 RepID=UPI002852948E|nr:PEP-CTERM sorting domain-containing protein [Cerasicoccus frondis]